jgi:serine/threonine protein kinase
MDTKDTQRICPSCQKPLAPDVPMGLCPECLIKSGFPTGVETEAKTEMESESTAQSAFVPPPIGEMARLFPQLEILELIGKGGMGAVYKARQKQLNRFVALKILPPGIGGEPAFAQRFTREAQALAQLNHPGIVTLYEFGETSGQFYFLMEFVDGVNLRQLLAGGRVSPREALAIVPQICDALQFAHDQGIVHRDIKPENILLDRRGRVKVADFGLAKLVGAGNETAEAGVSHKFSALTEAGKIMGTPSYMAPEQVAHPTDVDHRADIYALGVVFYQMLTGELPGKKIEPPSQKVEIDVRLDEVVLRALEKEPERRYQQVSKVGMDIKTISMNSATQPPIKTAIKSPIQTVIPNNRKNMNDQNQKSLWYAILIGTVCVAIGLAIWLIAFHPQNKLAKLAALPAVQTWLSLMDNGDYGQSWETAANSFHTAVSKADWVAKSAEIRQPLGNVLSRKLSSTEQPTNLPGMPDGSYFVAKFDTAFTGLKSAAETVTFALSDDGQWKAIGYLILPGDSGAQPASGDTDNKAAVAAAQKWLAGIDDDHYGESWTDAADAFHDAITQDKWAAALESVRKPLGSLVSRKFKSAQLTTNLPGAPDGQYVVIQFETSFANDGTAVETVTMGPLQDGQWKASGYYIK